MGPDQAFLAVDLDQAVLAAAHLEAAHQEVALPGVAQEEVVHPLAVMEVKLKLLSCVQHLIVKLDVHRSWEVQRCLYFPQIIVSASSTPCTVLKWNCISVEN